MMMTWKDRNIAEGVQTGIKTGMQTGMQNLLTRLLTQRFGPLPARIRQRIADTKSVRKLEQVADQVLSIQSLQELVWD